MDDTTNPLTDPPARHAEWIRVAIIFGVLVLLILIPLLRWRHHETHRPSLVGVRVVAATADDPVYRTISRDVAAADEVRLAVALLLDTPGRGRWWLAPVDHLVIDNVEVDHTIATQWPEPDRVARVFWFTHECSVLGGSIDDAGATELLKYRKYLAPELGQTFLAAGEPSFHAADGINLGDDVVPTNAGTYRLSARVDIVSDATSIRPLQSGASVESADPDDPGILRVSRSLPDATVPYPQAGRLFRLPGFEIGEGAPVDPADLSRRLIATSSQVFASMAATGSPDLDQTTLTRIGTLRLGSRTSSRSLRWGTDVRNGDLLRQSNRWLILLSDNGDGILNGPDLVACCFRRPPAMRTLAAAVGEEDEPIEVSRPAPQ